MSSTDLPLFAAVEPEDRKRLVGQAKRVFKIMSDVGWWTLGEISNMSLVMFDKSDSEAGISARLRCFRKLGHTVERRRVPGGNGLHEYRLIPKGSK